ncbi:MAG: sugar phosphate isomerase/epimerase family protein, partial [bacterium]
MKQAKLAYATWPWGLEKKEQLVQAMTDMKTVGFTYFESVCLTIPLFRNSVAEFKSITEDNGVKAVSFYFYQGGDMEADVAQVRDALDFLAACGVKRMSIQATNKFNGGATEAELKKVLEYLDRIGNLAKPYGILPCLHPHANTLVMYENEIDYVMQRVDPARIWFGPDTAHLTVGRCDPVAIFKRYADRIRFVHLKDVKKNKQAVGDNAKQGFEVYSNFLELGQGEVDIPGCIRVLEDVGYDG